jgi:hypothetical protein
MKLIDMKSTVEAERSTLMAPESREEYPYGLRLSLNSETLAKLGMTELPAIDAEFKLMALVCVVGVSQSESSEGEPYRTVDLQIEQMMLTPAKEEAGEGSDDKAKAMYPTMLG